MSSESDPPSPPAATTSVSPSSFTYPFAAAPDIIRANQKDTYYTGLLLDQLSTILRNLYGARILHKYSLETKTFAELLYLSLTTLRNTRTLGEEYCDILHVSGTSSAPLLRTRASFIATSVLAPYILAKSLPKLRTRLRRSLTGKQSVAAKYLLDHLDAVTSADTLLALHLGVFYFNGAYYHLAKRLFGLRYMFTQHLQPHEQRQGYEVLGALLLAQLATQAYFHVKGRWSNSAALTEKRKVLVPEQGIPRHEEMTGRGTTVDLGSEGEMRFLKGVVRKCTLCLEVMKDPAATQCGHVFCWSCVGEWCRSKPECPLCRQAASVQGLLPLRT